MWGDLVCWLMRVKEEGKKGETPSNVGIYILK